MEMEKKVKVKKDWKYYTGMTLFIYCWIPYAVSGLLLFMQIPLGKLIGIMAAFIASSEISFAISIVLLGKPFIKMLEAKAKGVFQRHKPVQPAKPVSKMRFYFGIVLFCLSFIPCLITETSLFFGYPKTDAGRVYLCASMLLGYTIFIVSLFILGSDFWDRLKKLFQWPGERLAEKI